MSTHNSTRRKKNVVAFTYVRFERREKGEKRGLPEREK
jgi:hypothetical protein